MIEILKKTYLAGVGLASKTWEEVESLSKEVVKKTKMSEKEGAKFIKDMRKRYDETQKKTGTYIEKVVRDVLKKMDIATGADIDALKKDIQQLKKAGGSTRAKKTSARATTKKRTSAAKKRATTAPKTARRSSTTGAKKRTAGTGAKKRSSRAVSKKRQP